MSLKNPGIILLACGGLLIAGIAYYASSSSPQTPINPSPQHVTTPKQSSKSITPANLVSQLKNCIQKSDAFYIAMSKNEILLRLKNMKFPAI